MARVARDVAGRLAQQADKARLEGYAENLERQVWICCGPRADKQATAPRTEAYAADVARPGSVRHQERSRGKVTEHDDLARSSIAVEPGGFQMPAILFIGVPVILVLGGGLYFLVLR